MNVKSHLPKIRWPLVWLALAVASGCWTMQKIPSNSSADLDADADSDADGDVDTDGDADTDTGAPGDCEGPEVWFDATTELCWTSQAYGPIGTWAWSVDYCEQLIWNGHGDWHLPTIDQLRSLVRDCAPTMADGECPITHGSEEDALDILCVGCNALQGPGNEGAYCDPIVGNLLGTSRYWSSSTYNNGSHGWTVYYRTAEVEGIHTSHPIYIACVRD